MSSFWGITWAATSTFIYSPILIIALACMIYRLARVKQVVSLLSSPHHSGRILKNFSWARQICKVIFLSIGLVFLFLALARPQWGKKEEKIAQEGRDLFIALDISRSMLAQDCKPNRLACAKAKIKLLVERLSCERVGLILFSGSSFVQCPLTSDYAAFYMFLDQIDVETISSGTTSLDQAIMLTLDTFKTLSNRKNKLLAIFTDGEDFSMQLPRVKEEIKNMGLHIFAIGVGTEQGAPIPLTDERGKQKGHQKDKKGNVVISHLNEQLLASLAQDSGGIYIRMTPDDSDMRALIKKVVSYEKEKFQDKKVSTYQEQYPYFLAISLICFAGEWIL